MVVHDVGGAAHEVMRADGDRAAHDVGGGLTHGLSPLGPVPEAGQRPPMAFIAGFQGLLGGPAVRPAQYVCRGGMARWPSAAEDSSAAIRLRHGTEAGAVLVDDGYPVIIGGKEAAQPVRRNRSAGAPAEHHDSLHVLTVLSVRRL